MKHKYLITFVGNNNYYANVYVEDVVPLNRDLIKSAKQSLVLQSKQDVVEEELIVIYIYKFEETE